MKKSSGKWELAGFVFTVVVGTLLHFLYEWTGENRAVGVFSAVNESVWEHLKLLFFPFLIFSIIQYFMTDKKYKGFFFTKAISALLGMLFVVFAYYTYTRVIGEHYLIVDILLFVVAVALSSYFSYKKMPSEKVSNLAGILIFIIIAVMFGVFTFSPPEIPLFIDPTNNSAGI